MSSFSCTGFRSAFLSIVAILFHAGASVAGGTAVVEHKGAIRPRVLVLSDYYKDPDDKQSMIRLLVYANEFEIEGLVATSLAYGDGSVRPDLMREQIAEYGKVLPILRQHERPGYVYPTADALIRLVKAGAPVIRRWAPGGKGFPIPWPKDGRDTRISDPAEKWIGERGDSEASEHIISVIDRDDPRPVWVTVWGGAMDLARAINKVRSERSTEDAARFISKIRLCQSSWQDTGTAWLWENVPDLFFVQFRGMGPAMYRAGDPALADEAWVRRNVIEDRGPLGAGYPPANATGRTELRVKEGILRRSCISCQLEVFLLRSIQNGEVGEDGFIGWMTAQECTIQPLRIHAPVRMNQRNVHAGRLPDGSERSQTTSHPGWCGA